MASSVSRLFVKSYANSDLSPDPIHPSIIVFPSFLRGGKSCPQCSYCFHMELSPALSLDML